jgi:hypothetical protein
MVRSVVRVHPELLSMASAVSLAGVSRERDVDDRARDAPE